MSQHKISQNELAKLNKIQLQNNLAGYLYWLLIEHGGKERGVVFSAKNIAKSMNITLVTVYKRIKFLEEHKVISVLRTEMCNVYFLNPFDEKKDDWIPAVIEEQNLLVKLVLL